MKGERENSHPFSIIRLSVSQELYSRYFFTSYFIYFAHAKTGIGNKIRFSHYQ